MQLTDYSWGPGHCRWYRIKRVQRGLTFHSGYHCMLMSLNRIRPVDLWDQTDNLMNTLRILRKLTKDKNKRMQFYVYENQTWLYAVSENNSMSNKSIYTISIYTKSPMWRNLQDLIIWLKILFTWSYLLRDITMNYKTAMPSKHIMRMI